MQFARPLAGSFFSALQGGRLLAYLEILAVGSGVRIFGLASQFVVLIILGRLLSKESFGDLMTAFGFYRLVSAALGIGGSLVLLFHISRRPDDVELEVKLHRYSALLAALVSAGVALIGMLCAEPIANALGKPGLAQWFRELAPFAVFSTLLLVSTGALEGRSRVSESIALGEAAPNAVRIILLPLIAWLALPESYVAHVLTVSVAVPWLWSAHRLWDAAVPGIRSWTAWDYNYCGKFVVATLFANQLGAADILVAGALFSSETVADYAIASRLAAMFSFFQLAILKRFAPRAGHLLEKSDFDSLRHEARFCSQLTVGCGALTISALLLAAPFLLPLFGSYAGAQALLGWLAIPCLVQSFYAASDRLLIMAGQTNVALLLTGSSFLVLVTTPFITAPVIGIEAIPAAMIFSTLAFNPIVAARVQSMFAVATIRLREAALIAAGTVLLATYAMAGPSMAALSLAQGLDPTSIVRLIACGLMAAIGVYSLFSAVQRTERV
jgi:O-antigen/teichoic acid export membrane protein